MASFIKCERNGKIKYYSAVQLDSMTKYDPNHGWLPCDEKEKVMSLIPEELLKYKADRIAKAKEVETLDVDKIEFDDPNAIEIETESVEVKKTGRPKKK